MVAAQPREPLVLDGAADEEHGDQERHECQCRVEPEGGVQTGDERISHELLEPPGDRRCELMDDGLRPNSSRRGFRARGPLACE